MRTRCLKDCVRKQSFISGKLELWKNVCHIFASETIIPSKRMRNIFVHFWKRDKVFVMLVAICCYYFSENWNRSKWKKVLSSIVDKEHTGMDEVRRELGGVRLR